MSKRRVIVLINLIISGLVAWMIATFFASGAIGENYTDKTYVAPEFFVILAIWAIGAVIGLLQYYKDKITFLIISLVITWLSIPSGIMIGFMI